MPIEGDFDATYEQTHFHVCDKCGNEFPCEDEVCTSLRDDWVCDDCMY